MTHAITTYCALRSINNSMHNNASDFNIALNSITM